MLAALLLSVPYLVDVAYYGDLTPTHFAQVVDSHWKQAASGDGAVSADDPLKDPAVVDKRSVNAVGPAYSGDDSRIAFGSQLLAVASRISRPPPLC